MYQHLCYIVSGCELPVVYETECLGSEMFKAVKILHCIYSQDSLWKVVTAIINPHSITVIVVILSTRRPLKLFTHKKSHRTQKCSVFNSTVAVVSSMTLLTCMHCTRLQSAYLPRGTVDIVGQGL